MSGGIPATTITLTLPNDPRLFVATHKQCMREGNKSGMHLHHRRHIPWHFQSFAVAKYGYQPRSKKYEKRKSKLKGHNLPNVYSGRSRDAATSTHDVTATPTASRLTFRLAITGGLTGRVLDAAAAARLYAAGKRKNIGFTQKQVDGQKLILQRIAEMQVFTSDEVKAVAEEVRRVYVAKANEPTAKYRVRIKVSK